MLVLIPEANDTRRPLMESATTTTSTQDKQVTIDVPEDRVAEFYAFYARFLAGRGRGRRGGPGGRRGRHHGPCHGHQGHERHAEGNEAPEVAEA
jgi:hypothetical protein